MTKGAKSTPRTFGREAQIHRLALRKEDFLEHVFSEQCAMSQVVLRGRFLSSAPRVVQRDHAEGSRFDRWGPEANSGADQGEPEGLVRNRSPGPRGAPKPTDRLKPNSNPKSIASPSQGGEGLSSGMGGNNVATTPLM